MGYSRKNKKFRSAAEDPLWLQNGGAGAAVLGFRWPNRAASVAFVMTEIITVISL
jgi:hypothetical protein